MFTWNFQYMSKARLADTLNQLMLNTGPSDILVRIHTSIHQPDEAVELARFIKKQVPRAQIFGTTTSAVINWGRIIQNQCIISISQMGDGHIRSILIPTIDKKNGMPVPPEKLAKHLKKEIISTDTKFMLTFLTSHYDPIESFIESCNLTFPGVQMIGGIANFPSSDFEDSLEKAFIFNESGYTTDGLIAAAISGPNLDVFTSYATGAQAIGDEFEAGTQDKLADRPELLDLFPYVYSDISDIPIRAFHAKGHRVKRAFIHDRKIISDNRALFRRIENFDKAETLFGYSCVARSMIYSNCAKWELSVYENSNLCGCITGGEIAYADGQNTFANYTFTVSVMGEAASRQECNPYVFTYTDSLAADNRELLEYLMDVEARFESGELKGSDSLKAFVTDCEQKILYSEHEDIPNAAAMAMDIKIKGYDRICMIDVPDTSSMTSAFSDHIIKLTYRNYLTKCDSYAREKGYHVYLIDRWQIAIGAPSYMVALSTFTADMEVLQRELFEASEELIAIVPIICVIDGCSVEELSSVYNAARIDMMNKNIQFTICHAGTEQIDDESIREKYRMVNIINYAISHDKVIPYFQGIYDNKQHSIHHYESLMRIEDETGKIYYPNDFLDVARSYGLLYDSMSLMMIKKVFEKFKALDDISVSMNIGIRDIKNKRIINFIYDSLSTVDHPENFIFEILENEDIDDYDVLVRFVDKIHELGGKISIDDFGSGYSNLQHIISIHMDYIKIDGSIVRHCCEDKGAENLIALISAWREVSFNNVKIVAEFVENEAIQKKLMDYYIDYSQGFLFSKPAPELLSGK
ncbi:MAG: EAL domain-containing protein [Eubacterium sp.]|nr:EAL domain-containing protein [Eubacterium sp.]